MTFCLQQQNVTNECESRNVVRLAAAQRGRHLGEGIIKRHRVDDDLRTRHPLVFGTSNLQRTNAVNRRFGVEETQGLLALSPNRRRAEGADSKTCANGTRTLDERPTIDIRYLVLSHFPCLP